MLPCLQTCKLACHLFVSTGRSHETPGSETKDSLLLTAMTGTIAQDICTGSLSSGSHKTTQEGQITSTHALGYIISEEL